MREEWRKRQVWSLLRHDTVDISGVRRWGSTREWWPMGLERERWTQETLQRQNYLTQCLAGFGNIRRSKNHFIRKTSGAVYYRRLIPVYHPSVILYSKPKMTYLREWNFVFCGWWPAPTDGLFNYRTFCFFLVTDVGTALLRTSGVN